MRWSKVNDRCIRSGAYQIAKYTVMGVDQYHVRCRDELIATKDTAAKAKRSADSHATRATADNPHG